LKPCEPDYPKTSNLTGKKPMKDKVFVDTNILIYIVKDNTGKAEHLSRLAAFDPKFSLQFISTQVISEFCNVAYKKSGSF
jgi:predicted nucleic acid-binding protein